MEYLNLYVSHIDTHAMSSKVFLYCHLLLKENKIYEQVENTHFYGLLWTMQDTAQHVIREKHILLSKLKKVLLYKSSNK